MAEIFRIKKEHRMIGNEITDAEFRGYMIAKMEEFTAQHVRLFAEIEKHSADDNNRFSSQGAEIASLKLYREKQLGFIAGVGLLAGFIGAIATAAIIRFLFGG